jgi:hypothetical protein
MRIPTKYKDNDEGAYSQVPDIDDVSPDTYDHNVDTEVEFFDMGQSHAWKSLEMKEGT